MIDRLDHVVLTVRSIDRAARFYTEVHGMRRESFGDGRIALVFGRQKINLYRHGREFKPNVKRATPGSADFCLIADRPLDLVRSHLEAHGVVLEEGPMARTGALGPIQSIYLRDPDGNLIESALSNRPEVTVAAVRSVGG